MVFDLGTRGARRTFDLELVKVTADAKVGIVVQPTQETGRAPRIVRPNAAIPGVDVTVALTEIAAGEAVRDFEVGRYTDTLRLRRLSEDLRDDVTFEWTDTDPGPGGDWYHVRVRQIDGATSWSSPWWVGAEPPR